MKLRLILLFALATTLLAQAPGPGAPPGGAPPVDELKAYLALTDSQIQGLGDLRRQEREALRTIFEERAQKQRALAEQLRAGGGDPAALGRLLLEIEALRTRTNEIHATFRGQALALLNADQKNKVKTLEDAAGLREEIGQAAGLNLLAVPQGPGGPGPGGPGPGGPGPGGLGPGPRPAQRPGGGFGR